MLNGAGRRGPAANQKQPDGRVAMDPQQPLSAVKAFLQSHLAGTQKRISQQVSPCFVTISRQAGAGGVSIAGKIVRNLNEGVDPGPPMTWTVFNQNLVAGITENTVLHDLLGSEKCIRGLVAHEHSFALS